MAAGSGRGNRGERGGRFSARGGRGGRGDGRALLAGLFRAAVDGVDPSRSVRAALSEQAVARRLRGARRVGVFAVGKAAAGMFQGVAGARSVRFDEALVILPKDGSGPARGAEVLRASHPEPDASSVAAAKRAVRFFAGFGPEDVLLCLISGGASSLLCLPRLGLTLGEKRRQVRSLARSGAPIAALNRLRVSLSAVKGGGLACATSASLVTLVLSDVPGDRPETVGSGPTIRTRTRPRTLNRDLVRVVGSNGAGLEAAVRFAKERGWRVRLRGKRLSGEAAAEGGRLAREASKLPEGTVLLAGGETTVRLSSRPGRGGRSLELALGAARRLHGLPITMLAAGSDGVDGSSGAAGAFADGTTLARAASRGLSRKKTLEKHDSAPLFEALGDLFVTGPTGTNVADWAFAIRG